MPLKRCTVNGQLGWKWGDNGKCYLRKEDAIEQAKAIRAGGYEDSVSKENIEDGEQTVKSENVKFLR